MKRKYRKKRVSHHLTSFLRVRMDPLLKAAFLEYCEKANIDYEAKIVKYIRAMIKPIQTEMAEYRKKEQEEKKKRKEDGL